MEVIGRGSITIVDGAASETDAWEVRGHRPLMISNVVLHSLPAGYRFDLRRRASGRRRRAPGAARRRGRVRASPGDGSADAQLVRRRSEAAAEATADQPAARSRPPRRRRAAPDRPPEPDLRILETRILRGPNYWAREPVIRMLVDLGILEEFPQQHDPGLRRRPDRLLPIARGPRLLARPARRLPHPPARRAPGSGHVAEHIALELQNLAGTDVRHGKTRARRRRTASTTSSTSSARSRSGSRPARSPWRLVNHLVEPTTPAPTSTSWPSSRASSGSPSGRPSGRRPRRSSTRPLSATSPSSGSTATRLVQLGQGVHQQRIRATMTSRTSAHRRRHRLATRTSPTSSSTRPACPFPAPSVVDDRGGRRRRRRSGSAIPCVVKPLDGNHGRGVHLDLRSEEAVRAAFPGAPAETRGGRRRRRDVRPRQRLPLPRHRRARSPRSPSACRPASSATAAHRPRARRPTNADPRRGIGHEKVLTRITVDDAAEALVRDQGFELDEVPPTGDAGQARPDRQHVDRRHVDRPDPRGPPRQRRDRRDGRPGRRPRRRRHRLHLPRHRRAGARDRRGDRRGQRRARLPDAHPPDRGRAAVRRPAGHRPALPAGQLRPASRSSR